MIKRRYRCVNIDSCHCLPFFTYSILKKNEKRINTRKTIITDLIFIPPYANYFRSLILEFPLPNATPYKNE